MYDKYLPSYGYVWVLQAIYNGATVPLDSVVISIDGLQKSVECYIPKDTIM